jgi:hypothetical protein
MILLSSSADATPSISSADATPLIARHVSGVDTSILRQLGATHTFDKLLGMPEIMRFIDKDPTLAQAFRNPVKFT